MRAPDRSLDTLERWLQSAVVRPYEGRAPLERADAWILPSRHLRPAERVAIYSGMYLARMQDCLREDYPALAGLIGEAAFARLVRAYLRRHPSRHYSLNFLGRSLPEFLVDRAGDGPVRIARRALLADVARLERSMSEVFDAPESPRLDARELQRLPPASWASARLRPIEAFRLHALRHRANALVSALRQGEALPSLRPEPAWVAVYRKDDVVWRADLSEPMHAALAALAEGRTLGEALAASASSFPGSPEELAAAVGTWFRDWAAEGFFRSVERGA